MLRFYKKNMIPELPTVLRPLALGAAYAFVGLRAGFFIAKNKRDDIVRRMRR
jgi:hypothetical protein